MAIRQKILVVYRDLTALSRIYLALLHRNYKVEATNDTGEIVERSKRLKPAVTILGEQEFLDARQDLKTPAIVLVDAEQPSSTVFPDDVIVLEKNSQVEKLVSAIDHLSF